MCVPQAALIVAATAVSAAGQAMGAAQSAATYRYQAKIADRNAQLTAEQAHEAQLNNQVEAARLYRKAGQTEGAQTAAMAANGVDLGFGSAADMARDTAMFAAEDAGQLYRQGYNEQRGYDIKASNDRAEAQGARQAASGAITKGIFDVAGTILGGATSYAKYKGGTK